LAARLQRCKAFLSALAIEVRPCRRLVASVLAPVLRDRLRSEDGADKKAAIIGAESSMLADAIGLRKAHRLVLPFPDFTAENLALLSEEYDFVVADRMLQRCERPDDAGREMVRILKPGGWFVCTACPLDFALGGSFAVAYASRLGSLFPQATSTAGARPMARWIVGRKNAHGAGIAPSVAIKKGRRAHYRFDPQPARFGIMAMHRNEAPYLLEWIAYHRLLGFRQITLYDNESNDASARILAPLARAGIVDVRTWRSRPAQQVKAHNHALKRLRGRVEWCLFADLDEFLVLDPEHTLEDIVPHDPEVCAVAIPWRVYTSAGQRNRGTELTIERFTRAVITNDRHVKSLVRLRDVSVMGVHLPSTFRGRLIDIGGDQVDPRTGGILPRPASGAARINHYFTRSWEEFECKRARGDAHTAGAFRPASDFNLSHKPDVEVRTILGCLPALVQEMGRLRAIVGWKSKR
jgi:SAM-dependent methyltransferase